MEWYRLQLPEERQLQPGDNQKVIRGRYDWSDESGGFRGLVRD